MRISRRVAGISGVAIAVSLAAVLLHTWWFTWLGGYLDEEQMPERAQAISVLGGDLRGNRILKAAALAKQGFAPWVLVSGAGALYGQHESDLAVAFAVGKGLDEKLFVKLRYPAESTRDEAHAIVAELRRRQVTSFLVVTSNFHTRRAAEVFREQAGGMHFRMIGCPDLYFTPGGWWKSREGEKTFVNEWAKTVASWFGV